ncbi:MAG TPA: PqqD family protein [Longimicrobium sp.]|nr:PqqD family protein [Longimicrobium sp.]
MSDAGAPSITPETVVVAARDQVSAGLEGEAVILNLADGVYYGLDGVGARVWELLSTPRPAAEIRDAVAAEFGVDAATAWRDLEGLLAELATKRLVEITPGG